MAAPLRATLAVDGILVYGTVLSTDAFIDAHMKQRSQHTASLIDKLIELPLPAWRKWAVLYHHLQHQEAHFLNTQSGALQEHLAFAEQAMLCDLCDIAGVSDLTETPAERALSPFCHGGTGL